MILLLQIMHELELDDWRIKPNEIEIMTDANGYLWSLGQGAFGQVCLCLELLIKK